MTRERGEEAVLVAVVLSVAIHVGLMMFVRPQVMTHVVSDSVRRTHRPPMRVAREATAAKPMPVDAFEDLQPVKDAPAAELAIPVSEAVADSGQAVTPAVAPPATVVETALPPPPSAPVFEVSPVKLAAKAAATMPISKIETPSAGPADDSAPAFSLAVEVSPVVVPDASAPDAAAKAVAAVGEPEAVAGVGRIEPAKRAVPPVAFVPSEEIYEKVDEKVVAEEKAAVKELVSSDKAEELVKFVNPVMTSQVKDGWTYFRVMVSPRRSLEVVPKDFVILVDASGSIGKTRMESIRAATRRLLRSSTNSGDRFNLVAFRDRYSYAFRTWQECTQPSFDAAERWIGKLAAHGRTDVFATIRSVLTLPRTPSRPLIALVVTDGDANEGVSDTAEILSKFTALNDGLVSVYMYGVRSSANRELIEVLTRGNRGESMIYDGWLRGAGSGMEGFSERFRDPVLSDIHVIFATGTRAEAYPRRLRNLYRGGTLSFVGRVPAGTQKVSFSLRGLNGDKAFEGFFDMPVAAASAKDTSIADDWDDERKVDLKLGTR